MPELVVIGEQLLAPVQGGTGRYTAELSRALVDTAPRGWSVTVVVARHSDAARARIPGAGFRTLVLSRRVLALAWRQGIPLWPGGDAVHAPTPLAPSRVPRNRTLSVTVHDTVPWSHPETLTPHGGRWHRAMITNAARHATALVVPTEAVGEELHELARRNLLSMRAPVRVVAHGLTSFPSGGELILDLPERYVLAIGTIEPRKGIEVLIEAMALLSGALLSRALLSGRPSSDGLNEAGPALLLVGRQGWGNVDPFALARKYGLPSHRIKVLNAMTDAELAAVLSRAAVVAIPSLAEGFGLPLVEAMAAGIPVVYSNVPALMEVAGGAGLCVPRKDPAALAKALERILTSSKLTQTLSSEGLTRSKDFSWHTSAEAIWRIHT